MSCLPSLFPTTCGLFWAPMHACMLLPLQVVEFLWNLQQNYSSNVLLFEMLIHYCGASNCFDAKSKQNVPILQKVLALPSLPHASHFSFVVLCLFIIYMGTTGLQPPALCAVYCSYWGIVRGAAFWQVNEALPCPFSPGWRCVWTMDNQQK